MGIILQLRALKKPDNEFMLKELAAIKIDGYESRYEEACCVVLKSLCE